MRAHLRAEPVDGAPKNQGSEKNAAELRSRELAPRRFFKKRASGAQAPCGAAPAVHLWPIDDRDLEHCTTDMACRLRVSSHSAAASQAAAEFFLESHAATSCRA
jgi:hypothetical protein